MYSCDLMRTTFEYPWYKEYKVLGLSITNEPYSNDPVFSILDRAAKKYKNRGFIQHDKRITYLELKNLVDRLATAFVDLGLKKSDIVATRLPISTNYILCDYAISKAGLIHLPCSHLEPLEGIEEKFLIVKPKLLVTTNDFTEDALLLKNKFEMKSVIIVNDNKKNIDKKDFFMLSDLLENTKKRVIDIEIDATKDIETLLFTGGTTGVVKCCMLSHKNIYANVIQLTNMYGKAPHMLMEGAISVLLGIPLFHSYGHIVIHLLTYLGFDVILIEDPRDTDYMIKMMKKYSPVLQVGVPTQFLRIAAKELKRTGIIGISGSAALPETVRDEFDNKGSALMEGYGLSEMSPATHFNVSLLYRILGGRTFVCFTNKLAKIPGFFKLFNKLFFLMGTKKFGTFFTLFMTIVLKMTKKSKKLVSFEKKRCIGIPLQDVSVKILDIETEKEIPFNEVIKGKSGQMCLNGPQRMIGYWPEVGSGVDKDGYIRTGDVVKIDENGYFYIIDRVKDMINVGGFKVYSREIDEILYKIEGVEVAATIGISDLERPGDEKVIVFIKPKPLFKDKLNSEEIIAFLKQRVAKYAVPKAVFFIDEMPLTKLQKIDKKALRDLGFKLYYKENSFIVR